MLNFNPPLFFGQFLTHKFGNKLIGRLFAVFGCCVTKRVFRGVFYKWVVLQKYVIGVLSGFCVHKVLCTAWGLSSNA